jgi:hypothetical protein
LLHDVIYRHRQIRRLILRVFMSARLGVLRRQRQSLQDDEQQLDNETLKFGSLACCARTNALAWSLQHIEFMAENYAG